MNSLTLKIELRYFEINIFKVFKIVNVYITKKCIIDEFNLIKKSLSKTRRKIIT